METPRKNNVADSLNPTHFCLWSKAYEEQMPTEPIVPAEGIWTLSGFETIEDTCNASSEEETDEEDQTASLSLSVDR